MRLEDGVHYNELLGDQEPVCCFLKFSVEAAGTQWGFAMGASSGVRIALGAGVLLGEVIAKN